MRKVATAKPRSMARQVRDDYGTRPGDGHRRSRQHHRFARCAAAAWFVRFAFELHGDSVAPMSLGPKPSDPPVPTGDRPSLLFTVRGLASAQVVRRDHRTFGRGFGRLKEPKVKLLLELDTELRALGPANGGIDQTAGSKSSWMSDRPQSPRGPQPALRRSRCFSNVRHYPSSIVQQRRTDDADARLAWRQMSVRRLAEPFAASSAASSAGIGLPKI